MAIREITVRGARQHNLKNINVVIPRNTLTVITGLSGSGKSSLAFDTILTAGMTIFVPYYYTVKEGIISACPKCPPLVLPAAEDDAS